MRTQPERRPSHARRPNNRRPSAPIPRLGEIPPAHITRDNASSQGPGQPHNGPGQPRQPYQGGQLEAGGYGTDQPRTQSANAAEPWWRPAPLVAPPREADTVAPQRTPRDSHRTGRDPLQHVVREAATRNQPTAGRADVAAGWLGRTLASRGWPLLAVLAAQAALSLRLVRSNTAFQDEALYLWSGHLEIAHLLHHAQIPDFATDFSGAPVIYPPIGAFADSVGGLAGARLLSLTFMLITTILLHGVTRRIFSSRASAFFAATLFVGVGSAQFLGAFATYDAMALMLVAFASWLAIRAVSCRRTGATLALLAAGVVVLVLANATKYASVLFDPIVITVATLAASRVRGYFAGLAAGATMMAASVILLFAAYYIGGSSYAQGIKFTTVSRASASDPALSVLYAGARWIGIVATLCVIGAVIMWRAWRNTPTTALACTLGIAAFLVPFEQARIHTYTSLFKHVGYGAWFAAIAGGYVLATLPRAVRAWNGKWTLGAAVIAVILAAWLGHGIATTQYRDWPDSSALIAALGKYEVPGSRYLAEDYDVPAYYLRKQMQWYQWSNTWSFTYTDPRSHKVLQDEGAYANAIRHRYFTTIVLAFWDTYPMDLLIKQDIARYGGYHLVTTIPFHTKAGSSAYEIWTRLQPTERRREQPGRA
jgi:hypothetical protein